jgi:uncharacterized coiled-coil DUF342 family protein
VINVFVSNQLITTVSKALQSKQELIKSNSELKNELKVAKDEISALKSQNDNYLRTIQDISNSVQINALPTETVKVNN